MVDNCIGDKEICDMWQANYKQLLNSVETSVSKKIFSPSFIPLVIRQLFFVRWTF